jgi:hypothetical protein
LQKKFNKIDMERKEYLYEHKYGKSQQYW